MSWSFIRSKLNLNPHTICARLLVEGGKELDPGLLVSSQGEGVGEECHGVHVIQLARYGR